MVSLSAMAPSTMRWMMEPCSSSDRLRWDTRGVDSLVAGEGVLLMEGVNVAAVATTILPLAKHFLKRATTHRLESGPGGDSLFISATNRAGGHMARLQHNSATCDCQQRAAGGVERLPGLKPVAEAEVGELDDAQLLEEHHVLWLQVPVHHVQPVAVGDGVDNLGELQDEVELGCRVDDLVEAHHVGVLHHLHAAHLLEKMGPCHWVQLSLIYHLHCNLEEKEMRKLNN
ncbi:hypothetical protein F7725_024880 [Dissostichus mawsoni]|uniref:Uncharacterized protein n=1 Tax=Dissostichus mawsoni TaxID=36200 RepID=A0A7J5X9J2_DISMA|nr:hypothetical protein F7725_024880 [Dissostichus mawsoni]